MQSCFVFEHGLYTLALFNEEYVEFEVVFWLLVLAQNCLPSHLLFLSGHTQVESNIN